MRKLLIVLAIVSVVALVLGLGAAYASGEDTETQASIATLVIPHTAQLKITDANPSLTLKQDGLGADSSELAFDAGHVDMAAGSPTLTVISNKSWKLSAKSSGFGDVNGYKKDTKDLSILDAGNAHADVKTFTSLTDVDQVIASSDIGVQPESHPCQYEIKLDYAKDIPGTYIATVTYTLVTLP